MLMWGAAALGCPVAQSSDGFFPGKNRGKRKEEAYFLVALPSTAMVHFVPSGDVS